MSEGEGKGKDERVKREKIGGVRRGGKGERRARKVREDRTREDCSKGSLQGCYCFLYSALKLTMQNPLNCGMSGCQNYPIRITPFLL